MPDVNQPSHAVVLLHGFAAHWRLMRPLEDHLSNAGYATTNWGYNSWFKPIEHHASRLRQHLTQLQQDESIASIDFVTHSMGCIVTRAALANQLPSKCRRWVMLAPPNKGSYVANWIPKFMKSWMKPLDELQAKETSYVNQLKMPSEIEIAVVEATLDYIVARELTKIDEEKDRLVVPGLHSQVLFRRDVATQTTHFLQHGRFAASIAEHGGRDQSRFATQP